MVNVVVFRDLFSINNWQLDNLNYSFKILEQKDILLVIRMVYFGHEKSNLKIYHRNNNWSVYIVHILKLGILRRITVISLTKIQHSCLNSCAHLDKAHQICISTIYEWLNVITPSFAHNWLTTITGTILYHMHSSVRRRIRSSTRLCHITINIRMCNPLETGYTFVYLSQYSSSNTRCATSILHCVSVPFIDN